MKAVEKESIQEQISSDSGMLAKYRLAMVGEGGNSRLFMYEVINLFFMPLRGTPGVFLRKLILPLFLGKVGKSVRVGANCTIRNGHKIILGDNVVVGDEVTIDVKSSGNRLVINDNVVIGSRAILNCSGGEIILGKATVVEQQCRLGSLQGLTIGCHCRIGEQSYIVGAGHATEDLEKPIIQQAITCNGPNYIGDHVRIGERVTILSGVRVGSHVTIASDSLVLRDVPDGCTVAGVPATVINEKCVAE